MADRGEAKSNPSAAAPSAGANRGGRTLNLLNDCNDALLRIQDEPALLQSVCRLIVETGGYPFAWVGYARMDQSRTIEPVACSGATEAHAMYLNQERISWGKDTGGTGPAGRTIRTGTTQFLKNLYQDVNFKPWKKEAEKLGFVSALTLPLKWDGATRGLLAIYAPLEEAFDPDEIVLLERLADNLSFGIQSIGNNRNRQQAENLLALENQVYQLHSADLSEQEFLAEILQRLNGITGGSGSSLILFEGEDDRPSLVQESGLGEGFADAVEPMYDAGGGAREFYPPDRTAIVNIAESSVPEGMRGLLQGRGIQSWYSVPLQGSAAEPAGVFTGYFSRPLLPEKPLELLMDRVSRILGNAIRSRAALLALRESQERFQLLSMATLDGIYDWNPRTGKIWVNETFRRTFGPVDEDAGYAHWKRQFVHPDDVDRTLDSLEERFALKSRLWMREYRHMKRGGNYAEVIDRAYVIYDRNGKPARMIGVIIDVTARKKAEWAIRESESRFQALYDDSPSMFFTLDPDGTIISANKYGAQHLGYAVSELVGKSILDLCVQDDKKVILDKIISCVSYPNDVFRCEIGIVHKYHDIIWVRATLRLIRYSQTELNVLVTCEDISETRLLSEQLEHQAKHDALTGLINRTEFERRLRRIINSESSGEDHSLCYLDLDQFKVINDTCGHIAGDELIRQVSDLLADIVRKRDTLARLGGDEFAILMEHCAIDQATRVARDLLKAVEAFRFVWEGKRFNLGVSIGVVPIDVGQGSVNDILSIADAACYAAKDAGRNRVHVYHADDIELSKRRSEMHWVSEINKALEEDRLRLAMQPIVWLGTENEGRKGKHYELLLRMESIDGDIISPGAFLPAAERYNLSGKLDRWVVDTALKWLLDNPAELEALALCSINLSGHSLGDQELMGHLVKKFETIKVPPEKICFEITETAAIANLGDAIRFIQTLKGIGCCFALDDFGTGLSSFNYLKNIPVDFLKIDGSFVRNIINDPIDLAMVRSINDIGHVMGKLTIAEFVESEEILESLREIGVNYAQGYAVSAPRPMDIKK